MMVRASVQDGHGAIELLYEDEAHHLMGKSHETFGAKPYGPPMMKTSRLFTVFILRFM